MTNIEIILLEIPISVIKIFWSNKYLPNIQKVFGDLSHIGSNPFTYNIDLNDDGVISKYESGIAFRNAIVTIAGSLALGGSYEVPESDFHDEVVNQIEFTKDKYFRVKQYVDGLFDEADKNKNGLLSTKKFLETFQFPSTPAIQTILENANPGGAENINKNQAFEIFALLALESEKVEEPIDLNVVGAQPHA